MSSTVSYWVREVEDAHAAAMELRDIQKITPLEPLWDATPVAVLAVSGHTYRVPITDDFAERYDVVRRVSAPRPSLDARSVCVTFVNLSYVTPGGQHPTHEVELWTELPLERADLDFEELAAAAADVWTEVDWSADDPGWWVTSVTLPDGTVATVDDALGGRDVGPRRK